MLETSEKLRKILSEMKGIKTANPEEVEKVTEVKALIIRAITKLTKLVSKG